MILGFVKKKGKKVQLLVLLRILGGFDKTSNTRRI